MKTNLLIAATAASLALLGSTAFAANPASDTMAVQATVTRTCTVDVGSMAFDITGDTGDESTALLTVECTAGSTTIPTVGLGLGDNAVNGVRYMTGGEAGSPPIPYDLEATALAPTNSGADYSSTITGNVAGGEYQLGVYNDSVLVSVTYVDGVVAP